MKQKVLVIVGPTAVGKTALGIDFAKRFNGEVISGDSMQVYRQLNVGTAKVTEQDMQGIIHHLIDILDPSELYSASLFQQQAKDCIKAIHQNGGLPIIVGGTGLYIEGLLKDMTFGGENSSHSQTRQALQSIYENEGIAPLLDKLAQYDPETFEKIEKNNTRRVIRALEVLEQTGEKFSNQHLSDGYDAFIIGLTCEREVLYNRINRRVDSMMEQGLLEEAKWLLSLDLDEQATSVKAIGYKELFPYLRGELDLQTCVETLKQNSRRYAKRQLTWFRNRMAVRWFDVLNDDVDELVKEVEEWLNVSF